MNTPSTSGRSAEPGEKIRAFEAVIADIQVHGAARHLAARAAHEETGPGEHPAAPGLGVIARGAGGTRPRRNAAVRRQPRPQGVSLRALRLCPDALRGVRELQRPTRRDQARRARPIADRLTMGGCGEIMRCEGQIDAVDAGAGLRPEPGDQVAHVVDDRTRRRRCLERRSGRPAAVAKGESRQRKRIAQGQAPRTKTSRAGRMLSPGVGLAGRSAATPGAEVVLTMLSLSDTPKKQNKDFNAGSPHSDPPRRAAYPYLLASVASINS